MESSDYFSWPDEHLKSSVAARYDQAVADRFTAEAVLPAVDVLAGLAGNGTAVEFAVGTGRLALPLAASGTTVFGIDFSEAMLSELQKKDGAERIRGDHGHGEPCATDERRTDGDDRCESNDYVACGRNARGHGDGRRVADGRRRDESVDADEWSRHGDVRECGKPRDDGDVQCRRYLRSALDGE